MVRLKIKYEVYLRYEQGHAVTGTITAPTLRAALLALADKVGMYFSREDLMKEEAKQRRRFLNHELIDKFIEQNGDGCDFISLIQDEITGKIYYSYKEQEPNDWDIFVDAYGKRVEDARLFEQSLGSVDAV